MLWSTYVWVLGQDRAARAVRALACALVCADLLMYLSLPNMCLSRALMRLTRALICPPPPPGVNRLPHEDPAAVYPESLASPLQAR